MKYSAVGQCIYCGSAPKNLGDEHVIPFSLNGALVLPAASCRACEDITHRYEQTVARQIFGNFRMRHKVQTRHPKKRPTHITIGTLLSDGTTGTTKVPVTEHPTMLFVYKFEEPSIIRGLSPAIEDFKWLPISIFSKQELDDFVIKYQWDRKTMIRAVPVEFARMLAKIAYSYAVAELGLNSFRPLPMTLDTILCRTNNVSYSVGGDWKIPAPDPEGFHRLRMGFRVESNRVLVTVEIRLFPAFETPQYRVVVGDFDFENVQHVKMFAEKTDNADEIKPIWRTKSTG